MHILSIVGLILLALTSVTAAQDPITTGSVDADQYTTVRVTRIEDGRPSVSAYRVPKSAR